MSDEKNYSNTLNLPKTEFPMRASLPENEPKVLENIFEGKDLYNKVLEKNKNNKPFVLHDGPPYANGEIHIGHAMNKILKDTIVRFKSLQGFYSPYIPGFDTHGMPTEKKAIEKLGLDREKIPVTQFRDTCKEFTDKYKDLQIEGFKRLGVLGDWENPYITFDPKMEARQIGAFGEMYKKGYIYKGLKPVYWCTDCETALAEAEIEYKDDITTSIFVKFPVKDSQGKFEVENTYVLIWTTTPWTLPGNSMIAVGADFEYAIIKINNEKLIMAKDLVENVMQQAEITNYEIISLIKGEDLEGIICKHPFLDRDSKVVTGSEDTVLVELETGSGCVHIAPSYGKEDYLLGQKKGGEIIVVVDSKGYQKGKEAGPFDGMFYAKSNNAIIEWLEEHNLLLAKKDLEHSYPHCWRCKKPVIFRATDQWFASIEGFREEALKAVKNVKWIPSWGEDRITGMIRDRADWCISRQRSWGVPLPIFYCKKCNHPYVTEESIKKVQDIFREKGSNAWFDMSEKDLMPQGAKCPKCSSEEFRKETDIMDVWFDSGSSQFGVIKERGLDLPVDLYLEGQDQYRGWFQSSLLIGVAAEGKAPYKQVLTHGFVTDGQGRKMSKSLGNGISPQEVIDEYGADILRMWVLSSDFKGDIGISKDILKQITEVYRKIRNTARYILSNTSDFDLSEKVSYDNMVEIDKWALMRLNKLIKECTESYENYEFHLAYHAINQFCVTDMSNFYLDIIKDRLYTTKPNSAVRRSAQTAMYEILKALVVMLTPMIPFTSEEIFKYMPHESKVESAMLLDWPKNNTKYDDKEIEGKWNKIIELKEIVAKELENARANKVIGHSLNAKVILKLNEKDYQFFKEMKEDLQTVFIVSDVEIENANETEVIVEQAKGEKCERCWSYSETVGRNPEHPTICEKCCKAIS